MLPTFLKRLAFGPRRRAARPERPSRRFRLEQLEDRVVPTLLTTNITLQGPYAGPSPVADTVNSTAGTGAGLSYTANLAKDATTNNAPTYATGAILLGSYKVDGGGQNNLKGDSLVLTYAIQGVSVSPVGGAALTANFTNGVMGIYDIPSGVTLNTQDTSTWGPGTTGAKLLYSASLFPAVATAQGTNPAGDSTFAGQPLTGQNQASFFVASGTHSPGAFVVQTNGNAANALNALFSTPNAFNGFQAEIDELNALLDPSLGGTLYSSPPFPSNTALNANFDAVAALDPSVVFDTPTPYTDAGGYAPTATGANGDALQEIGITLYPVVGAPTITTTQNPSSVTLGTSTVVLKDTADLEGGVNNPTGTITFTLYAPDGTTVVDTETAPVSGNGTYTTPTGFTLPTTGTVTGTYQWVASYGGDSHNNPASSNKGDEPVVVSPASPTIVTTQNPSSVTLGTGSVLLKDTADLEGGYFPTGTITFTLYAPDGTTVVDTETATVSGNGTYTTPAGFTLPTTGTVTGTYQWVASYGGDGNNNAVASKKGDEPVVVKPASPSLVTTATPNGTVLAGINGVLLNDSAVLSGGYFPTGTITFTLTFNGSTVVYTDTDTVSGNGTYDTSTGTNPGGFNATAAGSYVWTAVYSGDTNNNKASDPGTSAKEQVTLQSGFGGLTPGFWKNNFDKWNGSAWQFTAYNSNPTLGSVFTLKGTGFDFSSLKNVKFSDALNFQGGSTITDAAQILLRQAVAALLNATYNYKGTTMGYPLSASDIISKVNAALASNNRDTILALEALLDKYNNLGFNIAQKTGKPGS